MLSGYLIHNVAVEANNKTVPWDHEIKNIPANKGVRAYCILASYYEYQDHAGCQGMIKSWVENGQPFSGPFPSIARGPGVTEVFFHGQVTNAAANFVLVLDIFT